MANQAQQKGSIITINYKITTLFARNIAKLEAALQRCRMAHLITRITMLDMQR